jgi:hypothetical protein
VKEEVGRLLTFVLALSWPFRAIAQTPLIPAEPEAPPVDQPAPAPKPSPEHSPTEERLRAVENQLKVISLELEKERATKAALAVTAIPDKTPERPPAPAPPPPASTNTSSPTAGSSMEQLFGIAITSYVQAQYESHDESEDQLRQGGVLLNQNRFLIRRGRLKLEREWDYSALMVEVDGNTTRGPAFLLHHAEASVMWRGDKPAPAAPLLRLTMGLFDVPFGYELVESPRTRFFMERSLASRDFFPSEPDLGIRISGEVGWLRYALAAVNGEPNGVVNGFPLQDPNQSKDLIAKVGANVESDSLEISGDVSVLNGAGFVKGTDVTKNSVVWSDSMPADGSLRPSELSGIPALGATPSRNFKRWAVGADVKVRLRSLAGWTQLYGEVALASNIDRGQFVANPTLTNDVRELGFYAGVVQQVTPFGVIGFRADYYDPNADVTDTQQGKIVPTNQRVVTYSPMIGGQIPGRVRLIFQYDFIRDHLARNALGVPTDLRNDTWTLRMQGEL